MHVPHGGAGVYVSAQPSTSSGTPERLRTGGAVGVKEGGRACRRPESWREKSAANLRAANQSTRTSAHCARSSGGRLVDIPSGSWGARRARRLPYVVQVLVNF